MTYRSSQARQTGSSLLEVLVAIVIMSFGLLAMAGLAAASQQYVKMAQFQSVGTQLATELSERMRGNVQGFDLGNYEKTSAYSIAAATVTPCIKPTACTPSELAAQDIANWTNALRSRLPGGDAFFQRDTVNRLATDIWIIWADPDLREATSAGKSVASTSDCPQAAIAALAAGSVVRCMYYRVSL